LVKFEVSVQVPTSWFFKVLSACWPSALPAGKIVPSQRNTNAVSVSLICGFIMLISLSGILNFLSHLQKASDDGNNVCNCLFEVRPFDKKKGVSSSTFLLDCIRLNLKRWTY
jgi:hypothetical protein